MKGLALLILIAFVALIVWQRYRITRHDRDDQD
jgi:hypothetical protein